VKRTPQHPVPVYFRKCNGWFFLQCWYVWGFCSACCVETLCWQSTKRFRHGLVNLFSLAFKQTFGRWCGHRCQHLCGKRFLCNTPRGSFVPRLKQPLVRSLLQEYDIEGESLSATALSRLSKSCSPELKPGCWCAQQTPLSSVISQLSQSVSTGRITCSFPSQLFQSSLRFASNAPPNPLSTLGFVPHGNRCLRMAPTAAVPRRLEPTYHNQASIMNHDPLPACSWFT
jgi:hypothetical protein